MDEVSGSSQSGAKPESTPGILIRSVTVMAFLILQGVILFWSAGRLDWVWPWVYLGASVLLLGINGAIMLRISPETVAERARPGLTQGWDKAVGGLWAAALYLAVPLVSGLDQRYAWSGKAGIGFHLGGGMLLVLSFGLSAWAMAANAFFSTAVRIQEERGHQVCNSGPYKVVRHPGYVGFILQSLAVPILMGSWWGLLPGGVAVALMVARTALEDRMLQVELAGYQQYARDVPYRLLPGLW